LLNGMFGQGKGRPSPHSLREPFTSPDAFGRCCGGSQDLQGGESIVAQVAEPPVEWPRIPGRRRRGAQRGDASLGREKRLRLRANRGTIRSAYSARAGTVQKKNSRPPKRVTSDVQGVTAFQMTHVDASFVGLACLLAHGKRGGGGPVGGIVARRTFHVGVPDGDSHPGSLAAAAGGGDGRRIVHGRIAPTGTPGHGSSERTYCGSRRPCGRACPPRRLSDITPRQPSPRSVSFVVRRQSPHRHRGRGRDRPLRPVGRAAALAALWGGWITRNTLPDDSSSGVAAAYTGQGRRHRRSISAGRGSREPEE